MAVSPATTPAKTNDTMTAGPATGTAAVRTMKMPVPIVAPIPNIESWNKPIERASSPVPVSVPVSSVIAVTGLRRRTSRHSDVPPPPTVVIALLLWSTPTLAHRGRPGNRRGYQGTSSVRLTHRCRSSHHVPTQQVLDRLASHGESGVTVAADDDRWPARAVVVVLE